ncbi:MAG: hypothetical protein V1797_19505 [Pseudomonadota bacterium]
MLRFRPRTTPHLAAGLLVLMTALLVTGCGFSSEVKSKVVDYWEGKDSGLRKRVSVAPFTSSLPDLKPQGIALQKAITKSLGNQGGVVVVDFSALEQESQKVPNSIQNPEDRAYEAGRLLGLNAVLAGNITDLSVQRQMKGIYGFRDNAPFLSLEVELRLLDMTSSTVLAQESFRRQAVISDVEAEGIGLSGAKPSPDLVNKMLAEVTKDAESWVASSIVTQPWGGTVLKVEGDKVLVTVGRDTGLPTGAVLVVYSLGERIRCGTGQEICLPGPMVGKIRLDELGARNSWATIVERTKPPAPKDDKDKKDAKPAPAPAPLAFEPGQFVRTR